MLLTAQRPLVIAGGAAGRRRPRRRCSASPKTGSCPVGNAFRFQDTFDNHHPLYAGDVGIGINPKLAARVRESDLILAIGPRLGEMTTGGYTLLEAPKAQAEAGAHPCQRGRTQPRLPGRPGDQRGHGAARAQPRGVDARRTERAVGSLDRFGQCGYMPTSRPQAWPACRPTAAGAVDMAGDRGAAAKAPAAETRLTNGAGNFASWVHRFFRYHGLAKGHKTQLAPTSGAMGYGVPAGIAASIATGRIAFTIAGDGDFLMNGQELATAAQHGGKSIVVLLNNGMFGTIRMHQEREYPGHVSGTACATRISARWRGPTAMQRSAYRNRAVRGGAAARAGGRHRHADRDPAGPGSHHHARHAERHHQVRRRHSAPTEGKKKAGEMPACSVGRPRRRSAYLTCLPISAASSNIDTCGLPKIAFSLASALMLRLLALS